VKQNDRVAVMAELWCCNHYVFLGRHCIRFIGFMVCLSVDFIFVDRLGLEWRFNLLIYLLSYSMGQSP
jgi:hypothetical protein